MSGLDRSTKVAITTEEASPGVPLWGPNQLITSIPAGETSVALENLIAGRTYYMRTWTEDMFGNKSPYRETTINTPPDQTIPAQPTGLTLTPGDNGFQATWNPVADIDLAEYEFAYANDDGSGTGPGGYPIYTVVKTRATQFWVDQAYRQKTWCRVRARDFSNNFSDYTALVATTPVRTVPLSLSANGYLDTGSPMRAYVNVPTTVVSVEEAIIKLAFRQFMAPATAATTGGGSTSGSSSAASSSNGSASFGLGANSVTGTSGAASTGTAHTHAAGTYNDPNAVQTDGGHSHPIPHDHTTPAHTHALTYGTFEETYPVSHSVKAKVFKYNATTLVWDLLTTSASQTADLVSLNFTTWISGPGDYRIEVLSDAATPNGGRLGLDLFGTLTVVL